ncbi:MAG: hypothetical protein KDA31_02690 [Phycisphaerales bacterium]|nr:hypothetical protein [Phycisphaerales bacterium]MCB9837043.1 hypothetical protein [Phycisphaera sp.]
MKRAIVGILLTACLTGCNSGKRIAKANDALRLERETLKEQVTSLEAENAELKSKNSELNNRLESPIPNDVLAALPRVAKIELTRYCQIEETDDGPVAILYFKTLDGRGRFVQAVGSASASLYQLVIPTDPETGNVTGEAVLVTLGQIELQPQQLRDQYIEGLGGSAYLARVPLKHMPNELASYSVTLKDSITGATHRDTRDVVR